MKSIIAISSLVLVIPVIAAGECAAQSLWQNHGLGWQSPSPAQFGWQGANQYSSVPVAPGLSRVYQLDHQSGLKFPVAYKTWHPVTGQPTNLVPLYQHATSGQLWNQNSMPPQSFPPGIANVTISRPWHYGASQSVHFNNRFQNDGVSPWGVQPGVPMNGLQFFPGARHSMTVWSSSW